jgi:membrane-bound lytic murein transglycosylase MltF
LLNTITTNRYNYYFDKKLTKGFKVSRLIGKSSYVFYGILFFIIVSLLCANLYLNKKEKESEEIKGLEKFIHAFMQIYKVDNFSDAEVSQLAYRISDFSKKYEIDPLLVLSVMSVESSFNKDAVSPVGARGLMQIMPETAKFLAKELGIKYHGLKGIHDIEYNIMLGTYYLSKLADKYQRNMHLYLAAYNMGPANVDRKLREKVRVPRDYYSKILNRYKQFSF